MNEGDLLGLKIWLSICVVFLVVFALGVVIDLLSFSAVIDFLSGGL
jgi:hypothetical protein